MNRHGLVSLSKDVQPLVIILQNVVDSGIQAVEKAYQGVNVVQGNNQHARLLAGHVPLAVQFGNDSKIILLVQPDALGNAGRTGRMQNQAAGETRIVIEIPPSFQHFPDVTEFQDLIIFKNEIQVVVENNQVRLFLRKDIHDIFFAQFLVDQERVTDIAYNRKQANRIFQVVIADYRNRLALISGQVTRQRVQVLVQLTIADMGIRLPLPKSKRNVVRKRVVVTLYAII